jgi:hypothetical protein
MSEAALTDGVKSGRVAPRFVALHLPTRAGRRSGDLQAMDTRLPRDGPHEFRVLVWACEIFSDSTTVHTVSGPDSLCEFRILAVSAKLAHSILVPIYLSAAP